MTKARNLLLAAALVFAAPQSGYAVFTSDNCYTDSQFGSSSHFDEQFFDASCAAGGGPWDLSGIPPGWYSIANTLKDAEFRAIMIQECDGDAVWAKWNAGTSVTPRGSANCELQEDLIRAEANGSATWARWSPGTSSNVRGDLQIDMQQALTDDFN